MYVIWRNKILVAILVLSTRVGTAVPVSILSIPTIAIAYMRMLVSYRTPVADTFVSTEQDSGNAAAVLSSSRVVYYCTYLYGWMDHRPSFYCNSHACLPDFGWILSQFCVARVVLMVLNITLAVSCVGGGSLTPITGTAFFVVVATVLALR